MSGLHKKGLFFLIDAFIGSMIIFASLAIILSSDVKPTKFENDYMLAEDISSFLINTQMEDINNQRVKDLMEMGLVRNPKVTVMEQVDWWYYNARYVCSPSNASCIELNLNLSREIILNLTDPLLAKKYGFSYTIFDASKGINETIYVKNNSTLNDSRQVIASRKITFLQVDSSTMFGPQIVEIKVWT